MKRFSLVVLVVSSLFLLMGRQTHAQHDVCGDVTTISTMECSALVALYESSTEAEWQNRTNWLVDNDPCSWYGVTCQDGMVRYLTLSGNNLTGVIPPEIGDLTHLRLLDVAENNLRGPLPAEIAALTQLERLYLNDNPLSGEIPAEMATLANLETLWLYHTNLCDPQADWFSQLADAQVSGMVCPATSMADGATDDTTVMAVSINLAQPVELICANVTDISEAECLTLVALYQQTNGAEWADNTDWTETETACSWQGVTCEDNQVTELALADNNLEGTLPPQMGDLSQLNTLDLSGNALSGPLPGSLTKLDLTSLNLGDTGLCLPKNGVVGDWIANLNLEVPLPDCGSASVSQTTTMTSTETTTETTTADMMTSSTAEDDTDTESDSEESATTDSDDETEPIDEDSATTEEVEQDEASESTETMAEGEAESAETEAEQTTASAFEPPSAEETAAMPQSGAVLSENPLAVVMMGVALISLLLVGAVFMGRRD